MQCGIAALFLIGAWIAGSMGTSSPITASWVAASRADDTPPSAAAPQSRSDQPEVTTTAPQMDAQVTQQPTGSAAGARTGWCRWRGKSIPWRAINRAAASRADSDR
jgi:hypothetical protein